VQEVCDRIGILARGELVREGPLEQLTSIERQTEFIIEDCDEVLAARIRSAISESSAKLDAERRPQQSLEKVFLEATH
jgi:ABC-2 type transport system ATP-binding protein